MCGIAGYYCWGQERPTKEELTSLLIETMSRGKDATGVAFVEDKRLRVVKAPGDAEQFVKSEPWQAIETLPQSMIMHCRAATHGKPEDNSNNHPIFNKKGMAITHNGVISNHNAIRLNRKMQTDGEVDSEVILKLLEDKWWGDIDLISELGGSYACAAIWQERPDEMILFRHNNPISIYVDVKRDILFYASIQSFLEKALARFHRGFLIEEPKARTLSENKAFLIAPVGIREIRKFESKPVTIMAESNDAGGTDTGFFNKGSHCGGTTCAGDSHNKKKWKKNKKHWYVCNFCGATSAWEEVGDGSGEPLKLCNKCLANMVHNGWIECAACHNIVTVHSYYQRSCHYCNERLLSNGKDMLIR